MSEESADLLCGSPPPLRRPAQESFAYTPGLEGLAVVSCRLEIWVRENAIRFAIRPFWEYCQLTRT